MDAKLGLQTERTGSVRVFAWLWNSVLPNMTDDSLGTSHAHGFGVCDVLPIFLLHGKVSAATGDSGSGGGVCTVGGEGGMRRRMVNPRSPFPSHGPKQNNQEREHEGLVEHVRGVDSKEEQRCLSKKEK